MTLKKTILLQDNPATSDAFGPHAKIAQLIKDEILTEGEGRSIALVGEWGSGKSTVIKLLEDELSPPKEPSGNTHLFIYDAWSHQGDPLRRAFLDDLIASLKNHLTPEQAKECVEKVWNRTETTKTVTQPVMRLHAKIFFTSLALIPIGTQLFKLSDGATTWATISPELGTTRNLVAVGLMLAPLLVLLFFALLKVSPLECLKNFFFGGAHKEDDFSVLNLFFNKVEGTVEKKEIKSPADSIAAFKEAFAHLIDTVHARNPQLRLVIIIDNIDRIPADQARDFWSTMQTFFADGGGLRKPQTKKYWLVAPFSIKALSFIFADGTADQADPQSDAQYYIDKTFGIAFHVPPPIQTNWREYFFQQLKLAFPEHEDADLIIISDLFAFARMKRTDPITPREMKLFVNSLVVLYKQRGDEIRLEAIAAYLLHKDKIKGTAIPEEILSQSERRVIDDENWRGLIAALHYGVKPDQAIELILAEPIQAAIAEGSVEKLKEQEKHHGFQVILQNVVRDILDRPAKGDATSLSEIAALVGALESASSPKLLTVWRELRTRLRNAKNWDKFQLPVAEGLRATLLHATNAAERELTRNAAVLSISQAEVLEPTEDPQQPSAAVTHWIDAAGAIAEGAPDISALNLQVPGTGKVVLEIVQQLAEIDAGSPARAAIKLKDAGSISAALASEITSGRYLRKPAMFVAYVSEASSLQLDWNAITKSATARLRVPDINAKETYSLITLLLTSGTIGQFTKATSALDELSKQGHLSHLLQIHQKQMETRAALIAATAVSNPSFARSGQVDQSENGDQRYNEAVDANPSDPALVEALATYMIETRAGLRLLDIGAPHAKIARISAAVIAAMIGKNYEFATDPASVVQHLPFLDKQRGAIELEAFIKHLAKRDDLLDLLVTEAFDVKRSRFYLAALNVAQESSHDRYVKKIEDEVRNLAQSEWETAIASDSGSHFDLVGLASALRQKDTAFVLSPMARDALLAQAKKIGLKQLPVTDAMRVRLQSIFDLLPAPQQQSLIHDILDEMYNVPETIPSTLDVFGRLIHADAITDKDRAVRRLFTPIVTAPTEKSVVWMLEIFTKRPDILRRTLKDEFADRLRNAHTSAAEEIKQHLASLASTLKIDLSPAPRTENPAPDSN